MSAVKIAYDARAIGAKEAFAPTLSEPLAQVSDAVDILKQETVTFSAFGNPLELFSVTLDGKTKPLPDEITNESVGIKSESMTNDSGVFDIPVTLTMTADAFFSAPGITLRFDDTNGVYCNNLQIMWYRDDTLLDTQEFAPDKTEYFCAHAVELFNKVIIVFKGLNLPQNRLTLRAIDFGAILAFDGTEIKSAAVLQQIDPLGAEIAIDTCDFTISAKRDIDYLFEKSQPLKISFDNQLLQTATAAKITQKGFRQFAIHAEDYIGLLDSTPYEGGIYSDANAVELMQDIFAAAHVPYDIADDFAAATVTGYIPYGTCRTALTQIAFAIGATVSTAYSDKVRVFALDATSTQTIPAERIRQGQSFDTEARVTAVSIQSHAYTPSTETVELFDASSDGEGDGINIIFDEPVHSLSIANGEIVSSTANNAIINAQAGCTLHGKKYKHTTTSKTRKNPLVLATDEENVISIKGATLINYNNVDTVLDKCYNYYTTRRKKTTMTIIEGKHESESGIVSDPAVKVGDTITYATQHSGTLSGTVLRQSYSLNGGILAKETTLT